MRKFFLSLMLAGFWFLPAIVSPAGDLYVDPVNGDNGNDGTTFGKAKQTLTGGLGILSIVQPGDTVWLADGEYREYFQIDVSGTPGTPITFRAINRLKAKIYGDAAGPSNYKLYFSNMTDLRFHGLWVGNDTLDRNPPTNYGTCCFWAMNPKRITFDDCVFLNSGKSNSSGAIEKGEDIIFRACVMRKSNIANAYRIAGSRILMEGCAFGEAFHAPINFGWPTESSTNFMVRGCVLLGNWGRPGCGYGLYDYVNEDCLIAHGRNGTGSNGGAYQGWAGTRTIFRNNRILESLDDGVNMYPFGDSSLQVHARVYQNLIARHAGHAISLATIFIGDDEYRNEDIRIFNNLFINNDSYSQFRRPLYFGSNYDENQRAKVSIVRNAVYSSAGTARMAFDRTSGTNGAPIPTVAAADIETAGLTNNVEGDPMFVSPDLWDFSVPTNSYVRDRAWVFATTVGAGTGTNLPVSDAYSFYPGMVVNGETDPGDLIVVGATQQPARVVGRDVAAGLLMLDRSISWSDGDPVGFAWSGGGPDIGPIEHGAGGRPTVQVLATAREVQPGTNVTLSLSALGCVPVSAEWWIGDLVKTSGLSVVCTFTEEDDYPIRARVLCDDGMSRWGTYVVTCRVMPQRGDVLLASTFDDATDATHWKYWKYYRPTPAGTYTYPTDAVLGRVVLEREATETNSYLSSQVYPGIWDLDQYPTLYLRYKITNGAPLRVDLSTWWFQGSGYDTRYTTLARTASIPEIHPEHPATNLTQTLMNDNAWHELKVDVKEIFLARWPEGAPRVVEGIDINSAFLAASGTVYRLANVEIRSVLHDSDKDGMPDFWEEQYFDSPTGAVHDADGDHDGLSNLAEYIAGADPGDPGSRFQVSGVGCEGGAFWLTLDSVSNRLYAVECKGDLLGTNAWKDLTNNWPGTGGLMEFGDGVGATQRFYRVKVKIE